MKTKQNKPKKVIRLVYWMIFVILAGWIMLWGTNSFYNTYRLRRSMEEMRAKVEKLSAVNDSLRSENEKLKTNLDAAEKAARERFGLVKPGEKVFRFIPAPEEKK